MNKKIIHLLNFVKILFHFNSWLTTQNVTWSNIISACSSLYVYRDQHAHLYFTRSADTLPLSNRFNRRPLWRFGDGVHHVAITRAIKSNTRRGVRLAPASLAFYILFDSYHDVSTRNTLSIPSVLSYWMIGGIVALGFGESIITIAILSI